MNEKKFRPGDVVREISLDDLLRSIAVVHLRVGIDLTQTDNAFGVGWAFETAEVLAAFSDMLRLAVKVHKELLRDVMIELPPDIIGVVTVNPLKGNSMEKPSDDSNGLSHEGNDLFPF